MATCGCGRQGNRMLPLYQGPWFTFRFAADRIIPRFHLEGIEAGRRVKVFKIDPGTGERLGLLAAAAVGTGARVDLAQPIIVRAGDAFIQICQKQRYSTARKSHFIFFPSSFPWQSPRLNFHPVGLTFAGPLPFQLSSPRVCPHCRQ